MTRDVLAFRPSDSVEHAIRSLLERDVGGAPVVDDRGQVVGLLEDDDLIVQDARLHIPTVVQILGAAIELPSSRRHFEDELRKAVGATVGDVMDGDPITCTEDATLEDVATLMYERQVRRVPVTREGVLVGIVARRDILRTLAGS